MPVIFFTSCVNDTVKQQADTVNDTVFLWIEHNNRITATEISQRLKMSLSTVRRKIKELKNEGKIERIGSDKTGYWRLAEKKARKKWNGKPIEIQFF